MSIIKELLETVEGGFGVVIVLKFLFLSGDSGGGMSGVGVVVLVLVEFDGLVRLEGLSMRLSELSMGSSRLSVLLAHGSSRRKAPRIDIGFIVTVDLLVYK